MADRPPLAAACLTALLCAPQAGALPRAPQSVAIPEAPGPQVIRVLDQRIRGTRDLPTAELQRLRKRMLNDQWISFQDMRRLADHGDGLAAFRYGKRLLEMDDPGLLPAAALYFATAAYAGRDYAVYELVRLLERRDLDFSEDRLDHLENAMRSLSVHGSDRASRALARFYQEGHPFGHHPEKARSLLEERAEAGDAEAAMKLATQAMSNPGGGDPERLRRLLRIAAEAENLGTRTAAENLLRQVEARAESDTQTASRDPQ